MEKNIESLNVSTVYDQESLSVESYDDSLCIENVVNFEDLISNIVD